jgi:ADP-ribose pyrophosphatase YjhB (NUDIX family)
MGGDGRQYPARPLVGVGAIVFQGQRVLLIRRAKPPRAGEWSLPGGLQRLGETVFAAAAREVQEETGCACEILGLVDVVDLILEDEGGGIRYHYTLIDVAARWLGGEPKPGDDAEEADWLALDRIGEAGIWSETERVIREAARRFRP